MIRSTSFLQTSILRAIVVLEIPDAIHWYEYGYLYGIYTNSLQLPKLHNIYGIKQGYIQNNKNDGKNEKNVKNIQYEQIPIHPIHHIEIDPNTFNTHTIPRNEWKRGIHIDDLAILTCTNTKSLLRLLKSAAGMGLFTEISPNRWINTQISRILRRPIDQNAITKLQQQKQKQKQYQDGENNDRQYNYINENGQKLYENEYKSLAWAALMFGNEQFVAQSALSTTVETGTPSFTRIYGDFWNYHHISKELYMLYRESGHNENNQHSNESTNNDQFDVNTTQYQTNLVINGRIGKCSALGGQKNVLHESTNNIDQNGNIIQSNDGDISTVDNNSNNKMNELDSISTKKQSIVTEVNTFPYHTSLQHSPSGTFLVTNNKNPLVSAYLEFNNAMQSISSTTVDGLASDSLLFHSFDTLIDIAGGKGHLLHAVLKSNMKLYNKYVNYGATGKLSTVFTSIMSKIGLTNDNSNNNHNIDTNVNINNSINHSSQSSQSSQSTLQTQNNYKLSPFNGLTKLTTAVLFDLPYTYDNIDTLHEVETTFGQLLSIYNNDIENSFLNNINGNINYQCTNLNHIQLAQDLVPNNYQTQYQQTTSMTTTSTLSSNPNQSQLQSKSTSTIPCTGFTIQAGSFFNVTSLPQSFELNKNIILHKFISLLTNSDLYTSYHTFLTTNKYNFNGNFIQQAQLTLPKLTQYFLSKLFQLTPQSSQSTHTTQDGSNKHDNNDGIIDIKLPNKKWSFHVEHETGYTMMQILHDWNQLDSITILTNLKHAANHIDNVPSDVEKETKLLHIDHKDEELYSVLCTYGLYEYFPQQFNSNTNDINSSKTTSSTSKSTIELTQMYFSYQLMNAYCQSHFVTPISKSYIEPSLLPIQFQLQHIKKVLVVDRLLPTTPQNIIDDHGGHLGDILMMNNFNNAQERTIDDFKVIFDKSGWLLTKIHDTRMMYAVVEGILV